MLDTAHTVRHRLSRGGNRQINHVLHVMATAQLRHPSEGQAYYQRLRGNTKNGLEAMRCLKRRLSDVVYRTMLTDMINAAAGPGGHPGTTIQSSAADSHPVADSSDQSLPEPANKHPRTAVPTAS
ncbi:MAG: transposase [Jatrophihabitans sp.]|uniref:transposase n=1 Tax=Jatrophihabitans sp. TaxID=1932789 RepID=UPI003F800BD5